MELLERERIDYTSFFRRLSRAARGDAEPAFDAWAARWRALEPDADAMDRVNPVYIPRNHLVEEALAAATAGDLGPLEKLLAAVTSPYVERTGFERYAEPAPEEFELLPDLLRHLTLRGLKPAGGPGRAPHAAARP